MDFHERSRILHQNIRDARIGDKVYGRAGWDHTKIVVNTVTAETKTTLTLDSGVRLSRTTGKRLGDANAYFSRDYHMYTPAAAELLKQEADEAAASKRLADKLRTVQGRIANLHVSQVTHEMLDAIANLCPTA